MTPKEKAQSIVSARSTHDLITDFILTGAMMDQAHAANNPYNPGLPMVRGWILDELEKRNPESFSAWLEQDAPRDEQLYYYMA